VDTELEVTKANTPALTGVTCSFCHRDQAVVSQMVAGVNGHHICNYCIAAIYKQLDAKESA
jgi:hypothetical protein